MEGHDINIAMLSDLHWDNPKCDRLTLVRDLEYCKANDMPIMLNGDTFCLMQGKYDPRRSKKDILPEHNKINYIDAVIETAVEFFKPYAHLITVVGYGNHETGIVKNLETDPLQRFVDLLNYTCKSNVYTGGYGGWLMVNQKHKNIRVSTKIKYYHGSGGGGIVTKGAINHTRALEMIEGFDVFTMGHIHENAARNDVREVLTRSSKGGHKIQLKDLHMMHTGTYKEEYQDGSFGWHVQRGAPPKPVGGRILTINFRRETIKGSQQIVKTIDSHRFNK